MKISKKLLVVAAISICTAAIALAAGNSRTRRTGRTRTRTSAAKQGICSGRLSNGTYSGKFRVTANGELSYYTQYLEIENGEIRIYPTFNSQTRELSFDIRNDNVKVSCE